MPIHYYLLTCSPSIIVIVINSLSTSVLLPSTDAGHSFAISTIYLSYDNNNKSNNDDI